MQLTCKQCGTAIGAEAIPALEILAAERDHILNSVARQLIRDIAAETPARLGSRPANFYCPRCLTSCVNHAAQSQPGQTIACYGCRTCRQSRALFECTGQIIAVLDSGMTEKWVEQVGSMRINWLIHRALFDFEAVEIIQVSDEDIERFAVQVGNDTDPLRQHGSKQMRCRIALTCHLSENSLRVLRRVFGGLSVARCQPMWPKQRQITRNGRPETVILNPSAKRRPIDRSTFTGYLLDKRKLLGISPFGRNDICR